MIRYGDSVWHEVVSFPRHRKLNWWKSNISPVTHDHILFRTDDRISDLVWNPVWEPITDTLVRPR